MATLISSLMAQKLSPSIVAFYSAAQLAKHIENAKEHLIDQFSDLQHIIQPETVRAVIIDVIAKYAARMIIPCAKMKLQGREYASMILVQVMVPFNRKQMTESGIDFLVELMIENEITCVPLCDMFFADGSQCSGETSANPRDFIATLRSYGSAFVGEMQQAHVALEQ